MKTLLLENTIKHLKALVAFDTTNPPRKVSESGIIDYLTAQLTDANIEVIDYGDGSINVYAVKGQPKYLFNFHIDTVPVAQGWESDPFALVVKDDKAYGLGSCDIKGAAACFLACVEQGLNDYAVLFSSDEEYGNSLCVKSFLQQEHNYDGVIVAEPTECKAVTAHRGVATAEVSFTAESGHSSEPRALTENAIHQATAWMSQALEWATQQLGNHYQNLQGTCLNLGKIEGGIKPNIIAPNVTLQIGIRPLPGEAPEQKLQEMVSAIKVSHPVAVTAKFIAPSFPSKLAEKHSNQEDPNQEDPNQEDPNQEDPNQEDPNQEDPNQEDPNQEDPNQEDPNQEDPNQEDPNQETSGNALLASELGLELSEPVNFWTEAALFSAAGYPAIVYGPGNIDKAHTANEWVAISDLETVVSNYWRILGND